MCVFVFVLGFYLASWGMLRGSTDLLWKSTKYLQPVIEYISKVNKKVWEIDVDSYTPENIKKIVEIYGGIKGKLNLDQKSHLIVITKILLGVIGFIPAFDTNFCRC